jgi:hypothetical protein
MVSIKDRFQFFGVIGLLPCIVIFAFMKFIQLNSNAIPNWKLASIVGIFWISLWLIVSCLPENKDDDQCL